MTDWYVTCGDEEKRGGGRVERVKGTMDELEEEWMGCRDRLMG